MSPRPRESTSVTTAAHTGPSFCLKPWGPGCAFLDYDNDGWLDILLVNGMDWTGRAAQALTSAAPCSFTVTIAMARLPTSRSAPVLPWKCTASASPLPITITMAFPISTSLRSGRIVFSATTGRGTFIDVTDRAGLGGRSAFSTSALWFDYDRDGLLDLFVCNYVRWSPEHDVFCSVDGKNKSYCTPEAYHGSTCWLFRNRGNGTFEDVTAKSGIFDASSKSLGVAMLDDDRDGWPDLFVANDTQPNKLYRNQRNGTFEDAGVQAGVAFSEDGRARAGMGVDAADFDNSGVAGIAVTNFRRRNDCALPAGTRGQLHRYGHQSGYWAGIAFPPWLWMRVSSIWISMAISICSRSMAISMRACVTSPATTVMPNHHIFF